MPNPKMRIWLDAADNIADAPDWFIDDYVLPELLRRRKLTSKPKPEDKPSPEQEAREGWGKSEGCKEFLYVAVNNAPWSEYSYFADGAIRIPEKGRWMYVRCPLLGANRKPSGDFMYWRHMRWMPNFGFQQTPTLERMGNPPHRDNCYKCGNKGTIWRTKKAYRDGRETTWQPLHSVQECKSQLNKHHPDKGGDPAKAAIWTERLSQARGAA